MVGAKKKGVGFIADHSGLNPFVTMGRDHHVSELLATLKRGMRPDLRANSDSLVTHGSVARWGVAGVHRVIVMDDGGKVECLVSQSDVLCLLEECIKSAYPRLAEKVQLALIVSFHCCRAHSIADCRGAGLER